MFGQGRRHYGSDLPGLNLISRLWSSCVENFFGNLGGEYYAGIVYWWGEIHSGQIVCTKLELGAGKIHIMIEAAQKLWGYPWTHMYFL